MRRCVVESKTGDLHRDAVRILLVGEERDLTADLSSNCHREMFLASASTENEVLQQLDNRVFDVALVNAKMLDHGGSNLLELMRRIQPMVQVIIVSDDLGPETRIVLRDGAFDVVEGIAQPATLAAKILNAYGVRKLHMRCLAPHS
jgi:DNA-binding NtrC family response regulator